MVQKQYDLTIEIVNEHTQMHAKQLILDGMEEHFGFLGTALNPDLNNIIDNYLMQGNTFLVGLIRNEVVCSGALIAVDDNTGRIVRMSVKKECRRYGFASKMIGALETIAEERGYTKIILKTLYHWDDAVGFYISKGYTKGDLNGESITMVKTLYMNKMKGDI
ncbi:Acetyltransferase (GNAT) family protein [Paenibacillus sp. 1_12]|uniref:GNAT family N-acetyltransferase n=1 Tax=Paenibacillus sp. 1_12 TaxID=1566278 RepID=UPI0008E975B2|nr:GNAT family N-acetyltransferase [Paenibacillus sp. 1_12]SFM18520.1 Acetyltransferase (GNAT) family protein [Paenibacillus sp. 1_12]